MNESIHQCPKCTCKEADYRTSAKTEVEIKSTAKDTRSFSLKLKDAWNNWLCFSLIILLIIGAICCAFYWHNKNCASYETELRTHPLSKFETDWWKKDYQEYGKCSMEEGILQHRRQVEETEKSLQETEKSLQDLK